MGSWRSGPERLDNILVPIGTLSRRRGGGCCHMEICDHRGGKDRGEIVGVPLSWSVHHSFAHNSYIESTAVAVSKKDF